MSFALSQQSQYDPMKSKVLLVLAVVGGLTIGFFVGRFQGGKAVSEWVEHSIIDMGAAVEAQQAVRVLTLPERGQRDQRL